MKALLTIVFLVVLLFSTVQAGLKKNKIQKLASENKFSDYHALGHRGDSCSSDYECSTRKCQKFICV
jgi:hypothetical protein